MAETADSLAPGSSLANLPQTGPLGLYGWTPGTSTSSNAPQEWFNTLTGQTAYGQLGSGGTIITYNAQTGQPTGQFVDQNGHASSNSLARSLAEGGALIAAPFAAAEIGGAGAAAGSAGQGAAPASDLTLTAGGATSTIPGVTAGDSASLAGLSAPGAAATGGALAGATTPSLASSLIGAGAKALTGAAQGEQNAAAAQANYALKYDNDVQAQAAGTNSAVMDQLAQQKYLDALYTSKANQAVYGGLLNGLQDVTITPPPGIPMGQISGGLRPSAITGAADIGSELQRNAQIELLNPETGGTVTGTTTNPNSLPNLTAPPPVSQSNPVSGTAPYLAGAGALLPLLGLALNPLNPQLQNIVPPGAPVAPTTSIA